MNAKIAFGKVLKQIRKEKKISQEKLALEAGLERVHISRLERGIYQPSLSTIFSIAKILECRPGMLVDMAAEELAQHE
ncbi:MAG: helix-turn-helix domain-containing protein [Colwellia sp.]